MSKYVTTNELREMYQRFFEEKRHVRISSAPLVPENDPSVLFTTAGMHPLVPYLKGQPHPQGRRLTNVQKCLRTTDISEVGDATHATVFEMLGNWSLGDYFKSEAIAYSWEFLTSPDWLDIDPQFLAVSVFGGDHDAPRDEESAVLWRACGVLEDRIAYLDKHENWWPAGGDALGPQGPDSEMFYYTGAGSPPKRFDPNNSAWVEIWNDVFMEFNRSEGGQLEPLSQRNVDTGMGLERVVMVLNGLDSIYEIDTYTPLVDLIREVSKQDAERHMRILADHIKAATFMAADEHPVRPAKSEQGYVLRRIVRRALRSARMLGIDDSSGLFRDAMERVSSIYAQVYPSLSQNLGAAQDAISDEIEQFERVLTQGLKQLVDILSRSSAGGTISGDDAFRLYETYGLPIELTQEVAAEHRFEVDMGGFEQALVQHQKTSRDASQGKFAGGLADHSDMSVKYHTATHLLHQALRDVLGDHVVQRGSNITPERLRFDFSHDAKLTPDELRAVERIVNEKIAQDFPVTQELMTVPQAKEAGALGLFEHKYGDEVSVYRVGNYSIEICGGPHVSRTGGLGMFRIMKEESAGAGVRRVKAILE